MNQRVVWCFCVIVVTIAGSHSFIYSQCQPDPALWGGGIVSPTTGELIVPAWCYDPGNGFLTVELRGLNGIADTSAGDPGLLGDDVPLTSALVRGTVTPKSILLNGNIGGYVVTTQFFNGDLQVQGSPGTSPFLLPDAYDIALYPTGLASGAFGDVEMAFNFGPGVPGAVAIGSVQFVPEPAITGIAIVLVAAGWITRRVR